MKGRLPNWAILAGAIAVAAAAFFASSGVTHWVMTLHRTDVVVVPGPTVYLPSPVAHSHAHKRALPAPAPAGPVVGVQPRLDANARPDHRGAHARPGHEGAHARPGHGRAHGQRDHGARRALGQGAAHHHGRDGAGHGPGHGDGQGQGHH
jgi:hypothetical protein